VAAFVTGANKGIGKEIARQLAGAGLTVYVGSRGERAVAEIGGGARLLVLDVTDGAGIAAAARRAGTLDIVVNNAASPATTRPRTRRTPAPGKQQRDSRESRE
jgi:NAD(P)-dependent dehydrogenase (short-subunit alcohol dehydrogenase family)